MLISEFALGVNALILAASVANAHPCHTPPFKPPCPGAKSETDVPPRSIVDTAVIADDFEFLVEALKRANLLNSLKQKGPFTVFAPIDVAFIGLLKYVGITKDQLFQNREDLATLLKYHVVDGYSSSFGYEHGMEVDTVEGSKLKISHTNSTTKVENANIIIPDIVCTNGLIHVIDQVMVPPSLRGDIIDTAVGLQVFSILAEALKKADLIKVLKGPGPFTVFAPQNDAFKDSLKALRITQDELLDSPDLADILTYHVVNTTVKSLDLTTGVPIHTVQGKAIDVTMEGGMVKVNGATVEASDVMCSNGVIHVVDKVLMPPEDTDGLTNIVDTAINAKNFTKFAEGLTHHPTLEKALKAKGAYTLFAPTDDAFSAALNSLSLTENEFFDLPDLEYVLEYHVVNMTHFSSQLQDGMEVETLSNGENLKILIDGAGVKVGPATVTIADVNATNGVIHVIDQVLLPNSFTRAGSSGNGGKGAVAGSYATQGLRSLTFAGALSAFAFPF